MSPSAGLVATTVTSQGAVVVAVVVVVVVVVPVVVPDVVVVVPVVVAVVLDWVVSSTPESHAPSTNINGIINRICSPIFAVSSV